MFVLQAFALVARIIVRVAKPGLSRSQCAARHVVGDKGSVIVADSGRRVEQCRPQGVCDVAYLRGVLPHTVKDEPDMFAVQFHKL